MVIAAQSLIFFYTYNIMFTPGVNMVAHGTPRTVVTALRGEGLSIEVMYAQDSDGEKSDTDLVVDDVNNQMSPHNGDRRSTSPPLHSSARKTPGSGGSSTGGAAASGMDKLPKREPDQSARERDTSSRASSGSASGKHRDVSALIDSVL